MFDLLIKNGTLVDGSGASAYRSDLAVADGKIAKIAPAIASPARRTIDAAGKYVTPGFIDIHRHADIKLFKADFGAAELHQGLTTIVNGNCGLSAVPCPQKHREEIFRFLSPVIGEVPEDKTFETFAEYMDLVEKTPLPLNVGMDIGNGTVRAAVKGYEPGKLTQGELSAARKNLCAALEAGALGVSLGIVYAPENCYDADGFVEVLQPMREYGVPLVTHIRGEGDLFHESLHEVIGIAKRLEVPLHVSHFKCIGRRNWGHGVKTALEILDAARREGLPIDCDVYPYTAGSTQLIQILPPRFLEGGVPEMVRRLRDPDCRRELTAILREPQPYFENLVSSIGWENIRMSTLTKPENQQFSGKSVTEIAKMRGKDPFDGAYDLLADEECKISMVDFITSEEDIRTVLKYPYSSVISDSVYPDGGLPHPRLYAAFPKVLAAYVRDEKVLSLEEAVHKMTGKPALVYRVGKKGFLKEGYDADINVFALENIEAKATYEKPEQFSRGFDFVIVGGEIAVRRDRLTGKQAGRLLRRR